MPFPDSDAERQAKSDQIFSLLYTHDLDATRHFYNTKQPLQIPIVLKNKQVVSLIESYEPGPALNYEALRINLTALQPYFKNTPSGPQLEQHFRNLFRLKAVWLIAAVKFECFNSYSRMIHDYYVVQWEQAQVNFHIHQNDPSYIPYLQECAAFHQANSSSGLNEQFEILRTELETASQDLVAFKLTEQHWQMSHILWQSVLGLHHHTDKQKAASETNRKLEEQARKRVEAKKAESARRKLREETRRFNESTMAAGRGQMGVGGTQDLDAEVSDALLAWMKEQIEGATESPK